MTVILSCSSLLEYVNAAQKTMGTHWPVVVVDRSHHVEPAEMKQVIKETIDGILGGSIPADADSPAKTASGRWDDQFLVAEPGHVIRHSDFFD